MIKETIAIKPLSAIRLRVVLGVALAAMALGLVAGVPGAQAAFGIIPGSFEADARNQDGSMFLNAGGHPFMARTEAHFTATPEGKPDGPVKDVAVTLPEGLVGNPLATPRCSALDFEMTTCPGNTQVGIAKIEYDLFPILPTNTRFLRAIPIYNLEPPRGYPADMGFVFDLGSAIKFPIHIRPSLRAGEGYRLVAESKNAPTGGPLFAIEVQLWGVPADPVHDSQRCLEPPSPDDFDSVPACNPESIYPPSSAGIPPVPFLSLPTECGVSGSATMVANSWATPGVFETAESQPQVLGGCESVPFDPSFDAEPGSGEAGSPTGLDVELRVPQSESPSGRATGHLKKAVVRLPEGMTVNPSSADGLGACSQAQIGLGDDAAAACPDGSKLGSVEVDTPLLEDPLKGAVYLAEQSANPFGSLLALYIVAEDEERGVRVKLPGRVDPDPVTGRLTVTFDDNPQVPFEAMSLHFKGGSRAALVNPPTCGTKTVEWELTSYARPDRPVTGSDSFQVTSGPGGAVCPSGSEFDPGFSAGAQGSLAGSFSPFVARITRGGGKELGRMSMTLPEGVLAKLRGVEVCTAAQLASAVGRPGRVAQGSPSCPAGSQIGSTTVGAGAGSTPYYPRLPGSDASGRVFLTEAHTQTEFHLAGANQPAYGLAFEVPAVAGPFDLGNVLVRAAIYVDPVTAQLTVLSDRLPRILQGIPLDIRDVRVNIDRAGFTTTPTSCEQKQVTADIRAQDDTAASRGSRFQVGGCKALDFAPKLSMRVSGKRQTKTGGHPSLRAVLTQGSGQANVDAARVTLPKSIVLDPDNSTDPKLLCGYDAALKASCPASSKIGTATAVSPVLNKPVSGPVYLVQGIRFGKNGNRIRTLPTLLAKLRGEVAIDLRANSSVKQNRLVTTFPTVPDAPVSKFTMNINGGNKGILVVTRNAKSRINLCSAKQTAKVETDAHNNKSHDYNTTIKTPCAKSVKAKQPLKLKKRN